MRNRAKCKLCSDILESFHEHDWVSCKCGEISICGGNVKLECSAKDWKSFLRVDDQGNVIVPKVMHKDEVEAIVEPKALSKAEKIAMLEEMVKNLENLPQNVMSTPINHYDFYSYLLVVVSILSDTDK